MASEHGDTLVEPSSLSNIIRLSISSYGESPSEIAIRKEKLVGLGRSKKVKGYNIGTLVNPDSDYVLTSEEIIDSRTCCNCCSDVPGPLEECCFSISTKKPGLNLILIRGSEVPINDFKSCILIKVNEEPKGYIALDYPPSTEGKHSDMYKDLIPVAIVDLNGNLEFIFRTEHMERGSEEIIEIITADGTAFCVAKMGSLNVIEDLSPQETRSSILRNKQKKQHFCIKYVDHSLGRSWKQLLMGTSVVFV
ncbi:unnamed protein product [Orchesella dallaii]|uniref:Phospholipid scramblase n=1 Tax=Orchesella dallaii TaxID=48710 RepID=A0ABP1Q511_9HEXA